MVVKLAGGWAMDREKFSEQARKVFDVAIEHRRLCLTLSTNALRGARFADDKSIWARVESMFTEGEFMASVGPCIDAALADAGCADWWYTYEKRYDDEYYGECEVEADEDE